jgi:cytochrome b
MAERNGRVPVWDAAVRICHWALAAIVAFELWRDDGGYLHRVIGYVAVGIVAFRLAWAGVPRGDGGLGDLRPCLATTRTYLRLLVQGRPPRSAGHDPLGLWMVWLLWLLVLLLGLTGWMTRLDMFWGDDRVQAIHGWLADALLIAVCVHLASVLAMSLLWKENLPAAMLTGRKRPVEPAAPSDRRPRGDG